MKTLMLGFTMSLGILAGAATAGQTVNVDGVDYDMATLLENCQKMAAQPEAQIACFSALSKLLEEQASGAEQPGISVPDALEALRSVAQYEDAESGLVVAGEDCNVQVLYFNNYYHLSRRNISSLDLFSARFDASKFQFDKIEEVRGAQAPLSKGVMDAGATATSSGGVALESAQQGFDPKSPRSSISDYAKEVVSQLSARDSQTFEFVLIHPARGQASAEIWSAFEEFVKACKG